MPTYVTVLRSQLDELRRVARARRLRVVEAVAFGIPGEGVYHVFSERPAYQPTGMPGPAFFVLRENGRLPADVRDTLLRLGAEPESPVVSLALEGTDPAPVASLGPDMVPADCVLHVLEPWRDSSARSGGILESSALAQRKVVIAGLGSFGSTAAVELAKAGVGAFTLIDNDRLEPGNIARHACGVADVGRWKTLAVRDAVLARNPSASVATHELDVNDNFELLREATRDSDLMLCLTDGRRSRFNCNAAAVAAGRPALFGRAVTRAAGGDVFRYRPGGPCLSCLFSNGVAMGDDEVSSARGAAATTPDYAPEGFAAAQIQPGLASDIAPLVQMVVKLALVELAPRNDKTWDRLREDLEAPFYVWANRRELIYEDLPPMQYYFNKSSILRWYGVRVPKDAHCMTCGLG